MYASFLGIRDTANSRLANFLKNFELELRRGSCGILSSAKEFPHRVGLYGHFEKISEQRRYRDWDEYNSSQSKDSYTALVEYYQPLVRKVAEAVAYSLPVYVDLDDLISEGQMRYQE